MIPAHVAPWSYPSSGSWRRVGAAGPGSHPGGNDSDRGRRAARVGGATSDGVAPSADATATTDATTTDAIPPDAATASAFCQTHSQFRCWDWDNPRHSRTLRHRHFVSRIGAPAPADLTATPSFSKPQSVRLGWQANAGPELFARSALVYRPPTSVVLKQAARVHFAIRLASPRRSPSPTRATRRWSRCSSFGDPGNPTQTTELELRVGLHQLPIRREGTRGRGRGRLRAAAPAFRGDDRRKASWAPHVPQGVRVLAAPGVGVVVNLKSASLSLVSTALIRMSEPTPVSRSAAVVA